MMYHDCVVVPHMGALVAHYTTASPSDNGINKPTRELVFNPAITHNDGLLASSVARRHNMSYEEACREVELNVNAFKQQLGAGSELPIGRLGYFRLNGNKKIEFIHIATSYANDEFFGLDNIKMPLLTRLDAESKVLPREVTINRHDRMKVAASVAAIVGVGLLLSTPAIIDKQTQTAGITPKIIKTDVSKQSPVTVKPVAQTGKDDNKMTLITPAATSDDASTAGNTMPQDPEGDYFLVIKTCDSESKAADIMQQCDKQGLHTTVVARGKYYHISVAQSDSRKELKAARKALPHKYRHAKICH